MPERMTVRKWFWVWEFDKEEQWLNTMAQQGWVLDKLGFCRYEFVRCVPGEYTVRLEMRNHDAQYLRFMADTGAEYVGRMAKWIYFRKKTEDGPFDIFSDLDSRLSHLNRIETMLKTIGTAAILMGLALPENRIICLLGGGLMLYALGRIQGKREALEQDRLFIE